MYKLNSGQTLMIIRYGKKTDCIEKHKEVLEAVGECWFGKLGIVPSNKSVNMVMCESTPMIILYSQGRAYLCSVSEITYSKPSVNYPDYYDEELFKRSIYPGIYFKLTTIDEISNEDFKKISIIKSGNSAYTTLCTSMSSFFLAQYDKKSNKKKENPSIPTSSNRTVTQYCIYSSDGICDKRGFVNYQYPCERPKYCTGRK